MSADGFWRWFDAFEEPYKPLMTELSQAFGTEFTMWHTGGGCMALTANLEGGIGVMITDADDVLGHWEDRTDTTGYAVGVYPLEECDCWLGPNDEPVRDKCDHGPYMSQEATGWASSPAANSTANLIRLIKLALASVGQPERIGMHVDPALLEVDS